MWCDQSGWGLNLFLCYNNTCLIISAVPLKLVFLQISTWLAQRLHHCSKHFMKRVVWSTASASCDFAEVMVISLSVDQWSAVCGPWPFCKWPTDTSVTHDAKIIDMISMSYANKVSSEVLPLCQWRLYHFGDNIFKMNVHFGALAVCRWVIWFQIFLWFSY